MRVLIVDDEPFINELYADLLATRGHEVVGVALDGEQSLDQYAPARPDVVIMDYRMPVMDGIEATERILEQDRTARIVIVTADVRIAEAAFAVGARGFLRKPFSMEDLFDAIERPPRVESVYLLDERSGILLARVERKAARIDPDLFAGMLKAVSDFVGDTIGSLTIRTGEGGLSKLEYKGYSVLIQRRGHFSLVVVITGKENDFLRAEIHRTLDAVHAKHGAVLEDWKGDMSQLEGVAAELDPFVSSGRYDGMGELAEAAA